MEVSFNKIFVVVFFSLVFISCRQENKQKNELIKNEINLSFDAEDVFKGKRTNQLQLSLDREFLDQYKKDFWESNNLWGGFLVARNGKIIYENYSGFFNKEKGEKNDKNKSMHIASITKVFTATLILKLIEANYLSLDQYVCTLLTKFPYPEITIKMLLNHRSGLPKYSNFTSDKTIWSSQKILYNKDILALLVKHKPNLYFKSNTKFNYSNTNYALLALIIEKILKKSYADAMQKYIFDPLEMQNTFVYTYENSNKAAKSYCYGGNKEYKNDYLDMVYGDKNIYSTPRDLLKFDRALYSNKFLSKAIKDSAYKGYSYESKGVKNYGLGMRMMQWEDQKKILYHNGWWHGNNTVYVHMVKDSIAIIALGNKYSSKVYDAFHLIGYFGGYPIKLENKEEGMSKHDSIETATTTSSLKE